MDYRYYSAFQKFMIYCLIVTTFTSFSSWPHTVPLPHTCPLPSPSAFTLAMKALCSALLVGMPGYISCACS